MNHLSLQERPSKEKAVIHVFVTDRMKEETKNDSFQGKGRTITEEERGSKERRQLIWINWTLTGRDSMHKCYNVEESATRLTILKKKISRPKPHGSNSVPSRYFGVQPPPAPVWSVVKDNWSCSPKICRESGCAVLP